MYAQNYNTQNRNYHNSHAKQGTVQNNKRPSEDRPASQRYTHQRPQHTTDEVIAFCRKHYLNGIMIGRWIWVQFTEKPNLQIRKLLKDFGFHWSTRRGMWAHNCGYPSQPGNEVPWHKYPCYRVSGAVDLKDDQIDHH